MISRYENDDSIRSGKILETAGAVDRIRQAQRNGEFGTYVRILKSGERLDSIAGEVFQNGSLWWVIAATSGIGWALQVPPGTILKIPKDIQKVLEYV